MLKICSQAIKIELSHLQRCWCLWWCSISVVPHNTLHMAVTICQHRWHRTSHNRFLQITGSNLCKVLGSLRSSFRICPV